MVVGRDGATNIAGAMPSSWLATIARGPAVAPVRDAALASTYVVTRESRHAAVLRREGADGTAVELARSAKRLGGPDWRALAGAILLDATAATPAPKLVADLARFIVAGAGDEHRLRGEALVAWLESWRPALAGLFGSPR